MKPAIHLARPSHFGIALGFLGCLLIASPLPAAVTEAWVRRHVAPGPGSQAAAIALDRDGNVVVTGSSVNAAGNPDSYTAKYAAVDGALLWETRYNGPANKSDAGTALGVDGSGNVFVTGRSNNGTNDDYFTVKYAGTNGALLWDRRYNGPANGNDYGAALAVDSNGNAIITGSSDNGTNLDYCTVKYAAADGALLWERRYAGPSTNAANDDRPAAVKVDANGNVVVTGLSNNGAPTFDSDFYTAKYAALDGALLWERRYNASTNDGDVAVAAALDLNGNVIVTGISTDGPAASNTCYTAKYAAADGALLWERVYFNRRFDGGRAVATDSSGDVIVAARSSNGTNTDCYTAKYAAADGAVLWERRTTNIIFAAPGGDAANAVAVDNSGDIVMTGYSYRTSPLTQYSSSDYYTAKYRGSDGELLWEMRYNGSVDGNDSPIGLALGSNGMIAVAGASERGFNSILNDYATVIYREALPAISVEEVATGIRVRLPGVAGHGYKVLRAGSLTGPWSTNATLTATTNGPLEYIDTNAPPGSAFYRTSTGP